MEEIYTLSDIYLYPVKSLAGFKVERWPVERTGLKYDRKWMLIDAEGRFLSQRKLPKMALISTSLDKDSLVLSAPSVNSISLPLNTTSGQRLHVTLWEDNCLAETVDPLMDEWFSDVLHHDCRLVFQPDDGVRLVDQDYALNTDQTAFSDGFPFLIISQESLQSLNAAMQLNLSMARFRPNLVVSGCAPYAEDTWRCIEINDIEFRLPKPCSRCAVPSINPATAVMEKQPLMTLNQLRKWNKKIYFGQNAIHDNGGILSVGCRVDILQTGPAQPPL